MMRMPSASRWRAITASGHSCRRRRSVRSATRRIRGRAATRSTSGAGSAAICRSCSAGVSPALYADAVMAPYASLRNNLYDEMLGRIKQSDVNVPYRKGSWFYNSRTEQGKQYPIYVREKRLDGPEEVVLDVNKLAEGQKFMAIGD